MCQTCILCLCTLYVHPNIYSIIYSRCRVHVQYNVHYIYKQPDPISSVVKAAWFSQKVATKSFLNIWQ